MRKRIHRSAICSSENYIASKKAHHDYLKEMHSSFSIVAVSAMHNEEGELSLDRKMSLRAKKESASKTVFIKVFGRLNEISRDLYNKHFQGVRKYDSRGNEIFD